MQSVYESTVVAIAVAAHIRSSNGIRGQDWDKLNHHELKSGGTGILNMPLQLFSSVLHGLQNWTPEQKGK